MSISFPHCTPRGLPGKEPIIKHLQPNGKWMDLPSSDVVFDDIKVRRCFSPDYCNVLFPLLFLKKNFDLSL